MENRILEVVVPANVADAIREVAGSHGASISDWLAHLAVNAMTAEEQMKYRRAWADAAIASYEEEFGPISDEKVGAAERARKVCRSIPVF